jgi:hypothetical protein
MLAVGEARESGAEAERERIIALLEGTCDCDGWFAEEKCWGSKAITFIRRENKS